MHGPTFMANPLASRCRAGVDATCWQTARWREDVARIERGLRAGLARRASCARRARAGRDRRDRARPSRSTWRARRATAVEHGVWLRPFRNLIYAMPPYVTSDEDLERITRGDGRVRVIVVTGTDTGVGKTVVHGGARRAARRRARRRVKPAQTGVGPTSAGDLACRAARPASTDARAGALPGPARARRPPPGARACTPVTPRRVAAVVRELARPRPRARRGRRRPARRASTTTAARSPTSPRCSTRRCSSSPAPGWARSTTPR